MGHWRGEEEGQYGEESHYGEGEERHWGGGTLWGGEEGHYGEGEVVINYELTRQWG